MVGVEDGDTLSRRAGLTAGRVGRRLASDELAHAYREVDVRQARSKLEAGER